MVRKVLKWGMMAVLIAPLSALDLARIEKDMGLFSRKIEKVLKELNRSGDLRQDTRVAEHLPLESAQEDSIRKMINEAQSVEKLRDLDSLLEKFSSGTSSEKYVASMVQKMVRQKIIFFQMNGLAQSAVSEGLPGSISNSIQLDQFLRPDEFIGVKVGSSEGSVSVLEKGDDERVLHFRGILERHECDLISQYVNTDGDDLYNFYFRCKDFVTVALVDHFNGYGGGEFEVELELKSGGWLFGNSAQITFSPDPAEQKTLGWYRSVLEQNPFDYLYRHGVMDMSELGKIKEVAGEETLMMSNARFKMWIKAPGTPRSQAIYFSENDLGDLSIKGGVR